MTAIALLLGAGRGERMGGTTRKCFAEILGRPLLAYAVEAVDACPDVDAFVVVAPSGREREAERMASMSSKLLSVVGGGATRQGSVRVGLRAAPGEFDVVICHDVARPLASPKLFSAVLGPLDRADGAVPIVPIADTVKRMGAGLIVETVPRNDLALAQTPQAFQWEALVAAHEEAGRAGFEATDDAALLEWAGYRVEPVPGDPMNIKVTHPQDLRVAEALLQTHA